MPKQLLCLESDGPWPYQGQRGTPVMMEESAKQLAQLFACHTSEIISISQHNAKKLWQIS